MEMVKAGPFVTLNELIEFANTGGPDWTPAKIIFLGIRRKTTRLLLSFIRSDAMYFTNTDIYSIIKIL